MVNSETNLKIRRKRNAVIPIAQAENKITHSSFWDKGQDFTSDHRLAFDRFLEDITSMSMSMTTGTPVQPSPSPMAPVPTMASVTPVAPVSAPTLPPVVDPIPSAPSSVSAPTSGPVTSTTVAPVASTFTSAPATETTASPVSSNLTTVAPVPPATVVPSNRTSTPTLAPTPDRASATPVPNDNCDFLLRDPALLNVLLTVSNSSLIEDESTPQGAAYRWMGNTTNTSATELCGDPAKSLSLYSLIVLYFSTEGATWTNNTGWLVTPDYCEWYGITCNADGDVTEIALDSNNLQGTPPNELGAIESLEVLSAFSNNLTGTLPAVLNWPNLKFIDVENNQLIGPAFPTTLALLTALEVYRVSNNLLTGELATAPFLQLQQLRELWIAANAVVGSIPTTISSAAGLDSFIFYNNAITGQIPTEIGLLNLTEFLAYSNLLSGPIPTPFWNNTYLVDLRLEGNDLLGTVASDIGELTYLQSLRLAGNSFTGTLPPEITRLSNLAILSVGGTSLSGTIRDAFEPFTALEFADFSQALFTGTLPASIFDVPTIKALYFNGNDLTGSIPANYASAPELYDLFLNDNALTGSIPAIVQGQLSNLTELLLDNNSLEGVMPASVCDLRVSGALTLLTADHCSEPPEVVCDCCDSCSSEVP
ncbi:hypothetical protein FisN_19Hh136 [Fistulifera solaris]|uniref:non-specific serine/threonine protein kinase n=1 Tax=Fistulifera solaris TaxID=1519565 RepID=A0A1Z5K0L0_FISSO|nr:hypothetical protein FisN_19Hh136 [Fistulifera solaris]|eukprot:GAX19558.1 hypothetical protein FisN_19Hh136 [Fistulifera solaris]